jgi:broad specificity phosphatase PhoE
MGVFDNMRSMKTGGDPMGMVHTWMDDQRGRPHRLILIRHGESQANVDRTLTQRVPDHSVHLTMKGRQQALSAGMRLKEIIGDGSVRWICSPYVRTVETFNGVVQAFGGADLTKNRLHEEPRIREMEFGNFDREDMPHQHSQKKKFGSFYYRFPEGESPADVFDRVSAFLESLYRIWQVKHEENHVIVSHGNFMLIFLMRFLSMSVDDYYKLEPLANCEVVVLTKNDFGFYDSVKSYREGHEPCEGLRTSPKTVINDRQVWDGMSTEPPPDLT